MRAIRNITTTEMYVEGWDAFHSVYNEGDNPYEEGTYAYAQWQQGYDDAEDDFYYS